METNSSTELIHIAVTHSKKVCQSSTGNPIVLTNQHVESMKEAMKYYYLARNAASREKKRMEWYLEH